MIDISEEQGQKTVPAFRASKGYAASCEDGKIRGFRLRFCLRRRRIGMGIGMKRLVSAVCMLVLICSLSYSRGEEAKAGITYAEADIDLDLSAMSGPIVYAQIYQFFADYQAYEGKIIRMKGWLDVFQDVGTGMVYFSCVVPDAAACCTQGIEFVWAGEHIFPDDYPEPGTGVLVTGRFESYLEDDYMYVHLKDAEVAWESTDDEQR